MPTSEQIDAYLKKNKVQAGPPSPAAIEHRPQSTTDTPADRPGWQIPMISSPGYGFEEAPAQAAAPQHAPVASAPVTPPPAAEPPADPEAKYDPNSPEFSRAAAASRGARRGLGQDVLDAEGIAKWLDRNTLGGSLQTLAKQIPGAQEKVHQLREFVNKPAQSWTEWGAEGLGELAPAALQPELGVERGTAALARPVMARTFGSKAATKILDKAYAQASKMVQRGANPTQVLRTIARGKAAASNAARTATDAAAKTAGQVTSAMTRGAVGGAMGDPEHPIQGAGIGALTAGVGRGISKFAQSRPAAALTGLVAGELAYTAAHRMFPEIPYHPIMGPLLVWHYSPVNRVVRRVGFNIVDKTGRIIASVNPAVLGYTAGKNVGDVIGPESTLGAAARQMMGDPNYQ